MKTLYIILIIYLSAMTLTAFTVCGLDKRLAINNRRRVPEAALILLSILGGSIGMLSGMYLFNHKVKKPKFYLGVPFICLIQIAAAALMYYWGII